MNLVECEICGKRSVSDGTVWWSCDCHEVAYKFLKPLELKDPADKDIDSEDPIYGVPI